MSFTKSRMRAGRRLTRYRDGLHLSSQGYEVLHNKLTELIKTNFPELDPWDMEIRVPS